MAGVAILIAACGGNTSTTTQVSEKQEVAEKQGEVFVADTATSQVSWQGTHKGGLAPRWGKLSVGSGEVAVANGEITGGDFVIDMQSLQVDPASVTEADKKPEELEAHLKSPDFFHVEKHKDAKFEITAVTDLDTADVTEGAIEGANKLVKGNLTLKDSTLNVTFPAKIDIQANKVAVKAKFTVSRVDWGLQFGTSEMDPADWIISKEIEIGVDLEASKK